MDAYGFHSKEREYFDIYGAYLINELDGDGNAISTYDIGSQIDHARNNLDALVMGIQHRGKYKFDVNNDIEWGLKFQRERHQRYAQRMAVSGFDRLFDSKYLSSGRIGQRRSDPELQRTCKNKLESNRYAAFAQYTKNSFGANQKYWSTVVCVQPIGILTKNGTSVREHRSQSNPIGKTDMTFRFNTGLYYQPPFYREIRDLNGNLNKDVKAQQSIHFILGNDYEFQMWERDFKMTTEAYYKIFNDLNPYFVDNVRIRYTADNNSKGYGYGLDFRLFGQFVEGVDSWLSLSYARAYQNIDNRGDIPLPTDPRFKASIFFQDYMPILPSFKVNVNLVYASGLPNGAPPMTDPYDYTSYLTDYKGWTSVLSKKSSTRMI